MHYGKIGVGVFRKGNVVDTYERDEEVRVQLVQLMLQPRVGVRHFETTLTESQNLTRLSGKLRLLLESLFQQPPPGVLWFLLRTLCGGASHDQDAESLRRLLATATPRSRTSRVDRDTSRIRSDPSRQEYLASKSIALNCPKAEDAPAREAHRGKLHRAPWSQPGVTSS